MCTLGSCAVFNGRRGIKKGRQSGLGVFQVKLGHGALGRGTGSLGLPQGRQFLTFYKFNLRNLTSDNGGGTPPTFEPNSGRRPHLVLSCLKTTIKLIIERVVRTKVFFVNYVLFFHWRAQSVWKAPTDEVDSLRRL